MHLFTINIVSEIGLWVFHYLEPLLRLSFFLMIVTSKYADLEIWYMFFLWIKYSLFSNLIDVLGKLFNLIGFILIE